MHPSSLLYICCFTSWNVIFESYWLIISSSIGPIWPYTVFWLVVWALILEQINQDGGRCSDAYPRWRSLNRSETTTTLIMHMTSTLDPSLPLTSSSYDPLWRHPLVPSPLWRYHVVLLSPLSPNYAKIPTLWCHPLVPRTLRPSPLKSRD